MIVWLFKSQLNKNCKIFGTLLKISIEKLVEIIVKEVLAELSKIGVEPDFSQA